MGGKFSADQKAIYEGVLNAQRAVLEIMLPGTPWTECHKVRHCDAIIFLFCFWYSFLCCQTNVEATTAFSFHLFLTIKFFFLFSHQHFFFIS